MQILGKLPNLGVLKLWLRLHIHILTELHIEAEDFLESKVQQRVRLCLFFSLNAE